MNHTPEEINKFISATKRYWMVKLLNGAKRDQNEEQAQMIQMAHLDYMFTLKKNGKLLILGPTPNEQDIRGLCFYNGDLTENDVVKLSHDDPAVKAGRLRVEVTEFYGIPGDSL